MAPYNKKGVRDTRNEADFIYERSGDQLLLAPVKSKNGYQASIEIALDLTDTKVGAPDADRGPGGKPPGAKPMPKKPPR